MTTTETLEQLRQARDTLQTMADGEVRLSMRHALQSASLLLTRAIQQVQSVRSELVARAQLSALVGPAVDVLARHQIRHPEDARDIRDLPMRIAGLAGDSQAEA